MKTWYVYNMCQGLVQTPTNTDSIKDKSPLNYVVHVQFEMKYTLVLEQGIVSLSNVVICLHTVNNRL